MSDSVTSAAGRKPATFESLGLKKAICGALERLNFDAPTEIQCQVIPEALDGSDVRVRANTGDGKTNAYLLPILQMVKPSDQLQAVVLLPNRSLALQLERNLRRFEDEFPLEIAVAAGRPPRGREHEEVEADVLIATPLAARDIINDTDTDFDNVKLFVVDEVGAMLDERGPDLILATHEALPENHQTILTAAEFEDDVLDLSESIQNDPVEFSAPDSGLRAGQAEQLFVKLRSEGQRFDVLLDIIKQEAPKLAIVFTSNTDRADEVADRLARAKVVCRHVDERGQRGRSNRGGSEIIVASDPAPRRLNIVPATDLIHFDLPEDGELFELRLARCSRLRRRGRALALITPQDERRFDSLCSAANIEVSEHTPPEGNSRRRGRDGGREGGRDGGRDGNRSDRGRGDGRRGRDSNRDRGQDGPPRGEKRDRGPRRERSAPATTTHDAPTPAEQPRERVAPPAESRLTEVISRDPELDARGIKPQPRTLGSRFRSTRKNRSLRRA